MTVYQWLCLFCIPTIVLGFIGALVALFKAIFAKLKATQLGVKALLRAQMIADYNKWSERGYAPIYARQNFENCWLHYHSLGANGVMDDIHQKFLTLPTEEVKHNEN